MATITRLKSGSWKVQVRRKENMSREHSPSKDAKEWGIDIERRIDRQEPTTTRQSRDVQLFGDLIALHRQDLEEVGKDIGRSRTMPALSSVARCVTASCRFEEDGLFAVVDPGEVGRRTTNGARTPTSTRWFVAESRGEHDGGAYRLRPDRSSTAELVRPGACFCGWLGVTAAAPARHPQLRRPSTWRCKACDLGDVLRAFSGVARRSGGGNRLPVAQ